MSFNKNLLALSQFSSNPNNRQQAYNVLTTNKGGLLYVLIIYNYVLSIFITAS